MRLFMLIVVLGLSDYLCFDGLVLIVGFMFNFMFLGLLLGWVVWLITDLCVLILVLESGVC